MGAATAEISCTARKVQLGDTVRQTPAAARERRSDQGTFADEVRSRTMSDRLRPSLSTSLKPLTLAAGSHRRRVARYDAEQPDAGLAD